MSQVRGIDHVGLTVPDLDIAERFLIDAFGAELLYELLGTHQSSLGGAQAEQAIGLPAGARIVAVRMYRLASGPSIELFQYAFDGQRDAARACDLGWQHVSLYVDDLEGVTARAVAAGAIVLAEPWDLVGPEAGVGNRFRFLRTPFGAMIELVTYPSGVRTDASAGTGRWTPPPSSDLVDATHSSG